MIVVIHIILAVVLFYLVNWIGEKTKPFDFGYVQISLSVQEDTAPLFNFLFKVVAPVVYMVLVCAFFQQVGFKEVCGHVYLIVVYQWVFRFLYVVVRGQLLLTNWPLQIIYWICSIGLSIWIYKSMIESSGNILPDPKELKEELWLLIIVFLYGVLNKIQYSRKGVESRIRNYIINNYDRLQKKYGSIVDSNLSEDYLKVLVYSIMINENYNRPVLFRSLERVLLGKTKKPHTYGIMQVMSDEPLTDEESVLKGINMIKEYLIEVMSEFREGSDEMQQDVICCEIASRYNPGDPDYPYNVMNIYSEIEKK